METFMIKLILVVLLLVIGIIGRYLFRLSKAQRIRSDIERIFSELGSKHQEKTIWVLSKWYPDEPIENIKDYIDRELKLSFDYGFWGIVEMGDDFHKAIIAAQYEMFLEERFESFANKPDRKPLFGGIEEPLC